MKLRSLLACSLALALFGVAGCEKEEEKKTPAAQPEAVKAPAPAPTPAAEDAAKAPEKPPEPSAAEIEAKKAVEEAQKAAEQAKAEAQKALQEAGSEAEKARGEAAQAVEAAKAETEKARLEAEAAAKTAEEAKAELAKMTEVSPEEKEKLAQLAVDIECLKKKETDAQKMVEVEQSLFTSAEVDKATFYTKLNTLKQDEEASKSIQEAIDACPTFEDIQRAKVVGILVQNKCLRDAKVKPDRMGALQKEILESFGLTAEQYTQLRDKYKVDETFKVAVDEGSKSCPPIAEEEIVTEEEAKAKPKAPAQTGGDYVGKIYGALNGQMIVRTSPTRVTGGTVKFPDEAFQLNGQMLSDGRVTVSGKKGGQFIRGFGKFDSTRSRMIGNWTGVVDGKKKSGSFFLVRK